MPGVGPRATALVAALISCVATTAHADTVDPATERRPFDFALSLGVGGGVVAMDKFHDGVRTYMGDVVAANPEFRFDGEPSNDRTYSISSRFRMYLPHNMMLEGGMGYLRNAGSTGIDVGGLAGSIGYVNSTFEIPILVGAYLPVYSETHLFLAGGPTILMGARSKWSYDLGRISSFEASRGGGIEVAAGGDVWIHERVSMALTVRYRLASTGTLSIQGERFPPVQPLTELDFSGWAIELGGRWHSH